MKKYIIKNCRFLSDTITAGGKKEQNICGYEIDKQCADCTDCVLKQIVHECANSLRFSCERILAEKLLELLDIQEIE